MDRIAAGRAVAFVAAGAGEAAGLPLLCVARPLPPFVDARPLLSGAAL